MKMCTVEKIGLGRKGLGTAKLPIIQSKHTIELGSLVKRYFGKDREVERVVFIFIGEERNTRLFEFKVIRCMSTDAQWIWLNDD